MTKWADYGISAARYNSTHTHIDYVRAHPDNGTTIGTGVEYDRATILKAIKDGHSFVTIISDSGNWKTGQPVYAIKVNGGDYLKTLDNTQARDNLETPWSLAIQLMSGTLD